MRTYRILRLIFMLLLFCLVACIKVDSDIKKPSTTPTPNAPTINIENDIIINGLSFSAEEGEESITFSTDADWTLSIAQTRNIDWCTSSVTSGKKGTATVYFSVKENTGYDNRKVAVTIKAGSTSKTFTISQKQKDALLITTDEYEIKQTGGSIKVEVKANIDYKIEIDEDAQSWISENTTRALTSRKHTFTIAPSEEYEKREGKIYVKSGEKQEIIRVYQSHKNLLLLSTNKYVVSDEGEIITIDLKSNVDYGVQMPDIDWISEVSDTRAVSSHTLKYIIAPNETNDNRSAKIIFFDKNSNLKEILTIEQKQKDALIVTTDTYEVKPEGGNIRVEVKANIDYQIEIAEDAKSWISGNTTRALKAKTHIFAIAPSEEYEKREGEIYVKSGDKQETIKVYQTGSSVLILSQNKYVVSDEGDTITIDINSNFEYGLQMPNVNWISEVPETRGISSHTHRFIIKPNEEYDKRVAEIAFFDKNSDKKEVLKIEQKQKDALIVTTDTYEIGKDGGNIEVEVKANINYQIEIEENSKTWIKENTTRSLPSNKHIFSITPSEEYEKREGKIYVKSEAKQDTITIYQSGGAFLLLSQNEYSIGVGGKNIFVEVKSNFEFGVIMPNVNWISEVTETRGISTHKLKYSIAPNESYENRSAEIVFFDKNSSLKEILKINQEQKDAIILSGTNYQVSSEEEIIEVILESNIEFNVSINVDWVTQVDGSATRGLEERKLYFKVAENNTGESREAEISITNPKNEKTQTFKIKQTALGKIAQLVNGKTFNDRLRNLCDDINEIKSIEFVMNDNSQPTENSICLSTNESYYPIYGTYNNGNVKIFTSVEKIILSPDCSRMFQDCSSITSLDLSNFDTSYVTNIASMFIKCNNLESLHLDNFDTSKVTDMSSLFSYCFSLTSLDLSNFNTANVTDMKYMFNECISLESLNLSNFNTANVTNMGYMFNKCEELNSLNISNFVTNNVTNMGSMFRKCLSIESLNLYNFDTAKVTNMSGMFSYCSSLTSLDLPNFNTANVTDMEYMFNECILLEELDLSYFNTTNVTNMGYMFNKCNKLKYLILYSFNTANVTNMESMFRGCSSIESLELYRFNTAKVTNMSGMFSKCSALNELNIENFNTSNVTNMKEMFSGCSELTYLVLENFNTSNITTMESMFNNCSSFESLDLHSFDTSKVTNMESMFNNCSFLSVLKLNNFSITESTKCKDMFNKVASKKPDCTIAIPAESYYWVQDQLSDEKFIFIDSNL